MCFSRFVFVCVTDCVILRADVVATRLTVKEGIVVVICTINFLSIMMPTSPL